MVRNLFPNRQFGNGMFPFTDRNSEEKTVLNHQFGDNIFHSQMGIRNKTVLNVQLWSKLFHLQMGTRNKTVLNLVPNDHFGNKVFHSKFGSKRS